MTTRKSFGRKLQRFRKEAGLNVDETGEALGKSGKTISAWEVGKGAPKPEDMPRICVLFGKQISDFYDEDLGGDRLIQTEQEFRILQLYRKLNDVGRLRLYDYADDLVASGKYERKGGPATQVQAS